VNRLTVFCCFTAFTGLAFTGNRSDFSAQAAPILIKRCLGCHNEQLKNGNISFFDRESLLKDGSRGPAIVPGRPEASILIETLRHDGDIQMPPGRKLPVREIMILTEWIKHGAVWDTKLQPKK